MKLRISTGMTGPSEESHLEGVALGAGEVMLVAGELVVVVLILEDFQAPEYECVDSDN